MATIPARPASGRPCQTAASSATSVGIGSSSTRLPNRSARAAVTPATAPPKSALLRPPLPCGHQASRPSTIARIRRRSFSVSEPQLSTTCLRLAGKAPDCAPPGYGIAVFPWERGDSSSPSSRTEQATKQATKPGPHGGVDVLRPGRRRVVGGAPQASPSPTFPPRLPASGRSGLRPDRRRRG